MTTVRVTSENSADDSLTVTQVFCRLMVQASLIAVPAYLALFMIAVPFDVNAGVERGLILATPVVEFVIAAIIYSAGFLIAVPHNDLETSEILSRMRSRAVRDKMKFILLGSVPFLVGVFSGTILLLKAHL